MMSAKGMKQAAIAAELGVNQSTIARWLSDK
jgi:transcriptional regulator with XRE-family HTH domain